jgi:phage terminase Nu1 subunit (DNA packaging protein)
VGKRALPRGNSALKNAPLQSRLFPFAAFQKDAIPGILSGFPGHFFAKNPDQFEFPAFPSSRSPKQNASTGTLRASIGLTSDQSRMLTASERNTLSRINAKIDNAKLRGQSVELSAEEEKFLDAVAVKKNRVSIRNKALSGKPLSAREQKILTGEQDHPHFAEGLNGLAPIVGVTRRTLQNWKKQYPDFPAARSDNRYRVQEVFEWMRTHRVAAALNAEQSNGELEIDVRREREKLRLERERFEFERLKERMLSVSQFELALAKMISAFLAALNAFPSRVNEQLEGLSFDDRAPVLEQEVELVKKTLSGCDYLQVDLPNDHEFSNE